MVLVFHDPSDTHNTWTETACLFLDIAEIPYGIVDRENIAIDPYTGERIETLERLLQLTQKTTPFHVFIGIPSRTAPYARTGDKQLNHLTALFEWLWWEVRLRHD